MDLQKELQQLRKPFENAYAELIGYKSQLEAICNSLKADLDSSSKVHKLQKQDREVVVNTFIKSYPGDLDPMMEPKFRQTFIKFAGATDALNDLIKVINGSDSLAQQDAATLLTLIETVALHLTKLDSSKVSEYLPACRELNEQLNESIPHSMEECAKRGLALMKADQGLEPQLLSSYEEVVDACDHAFNKYKAALAEQTAKTTLELHQSDPFSALGANLVTITDLLQVLTTSFQLLLQMLQFNSLKMTDRTFAEPAKADMPEIPFAKVSQ